METVDFDSIEELRAMADIGDGLVNLFLTHEGLAQEYEIPDAVEDIESLFYGLEHEHVAKLNRFYGPKGWYLPYGRLSPRQIFEWSQEIDCLPLDELERAIITLSRTLPDLALSDARQRWPKRAKILEDAFQDHRNERYTVSIPVLLTQAEGISREILGDGPFGSKNGQQQQKLVREALNNIKFMGNPYPPSAIQQRILAPEFLGTLSEPTKDREHKTSPGKEFGLNRHGILHGIDIDYPSEANSLRCIMIVDYFNSVSKTLETWTKHAVEIETMLRKMKNGVPNSISQS